MLVDLNRKCHPNVGKYFRFKIDMYDKKIGVIIILVNSTCLKNCTQLYNVQKCVQWVDLFSKEAFSNIRLKFQENEFNLILLSW